MLHSKKIILDDLTLTRLQELRTENNSDDLVVAEAVALLHAVRGYESEGYDRILVCNSDTEMFVEIEIRHRQINERN